MADSPQRQSEHTPMSDLLTLPVLPLRDVVLFPGVTTPIGAGRPATLRDRKSTRLNSSHGYISYAVFCLKKKKKDTEHQYVEPTSVELRESQDCQCCV